MRTVRAELTDRLLIFGERHLRTALTEYIRHYNGRRPHRARELHPPRPSHPVANLSHERIKRRPVLGGLINEYELQRKAAGQSRRPTSGAPQGLTNAISMLRLLPMRDRDKDVEILDLRHPITVLKRQLGQERARFTPADRVPLEKSSPHVRPRSGTR
ncbi:hypothetical protein AB0I53_46670 [Saccharopolyspora sp. NPDC050389]|uniref:hypothetical protein n=1 Tax=Saccharopolyspora sp. NPDC050389 TaxID=3155516 RepID=UPI003405854C